MSKGLVLSSYEPGCGKLLNAVEEFEARFGRPDYIGGVGLAVPAAVLYAAGFSRKHISELNSLVAEVNEPTLCAAYFSNALIQKGLAFARDIETPFCVPVIDILTKAQFSFTNITEILTCQYETDLSGSFSLGRVVASAIFGLCEGFEFNGRVLSAGYRNLDYCANRLKAAGCDRVFCLLDDRYVSCEYCGVTTVY